ncbi:MAG TPA: hypothetical protein VFE23_07465 [Usitatibacter sp.]|jgi:hypothetical protein|nr:hypothetical protein [Usitatibacter sp.]
MNPLRTAVAMLAIPMLMLARDAAAADDAMGEGRTTPPAVTAATSPTPEADRAEAMFMDHARSEISSQAGTPGLLPLPGAGLDLGSGPCALDCTSARLASPGGEPEPRSGHPWIDRGQLRYRY